MKVSCKSFGLPVMAVMAFAMMAACPLPYEYNGPGASSSHSSDPSSPSMTAPVTVSYSVQGGTSGTIGDGGSFYSGQTTTVTLSTATVNAVIFYTDNGAALSLASLKSAKRIDGSSGEITITRTTSLQSLDIYAIAIGPDMLPSACISATVCVSPYPILSVTVDKASVSEDNGTANFTIASSSAPAADITVKLQTSGTYTTADLTGPVPASGQSFTATLVHGTTTISVPVTGVHNAANANPTVTLTIQSDQNTPPAYTVGAPDHASVVIQNDGAHTVTYNGNTGSGTAPTDANSYLPGATVTVLGNSGSLVKAGCAFAGWNTQANSGGTTYAPGQTFNMGSANVTLYAVWATAYTVTYNANGAMGSVPVDSTNYLPGQQVTTLGNTGNLAKSGSAFAGWTTNPNTTGTSASYATGTKWTMGSGSVTLYAVWIPSNLSFTSSGNAIVISGYNAAPTGALAIPPGVTSIGGFTFCAGLTSVTIPSSVISVASYTFQSCTGLTSVTISSGVATIGTFAFAYTGLTGTITIPASVTSIGGVAFAFCSQLTSILVDSSNPTYMSSSGVLFDKAVKTLVQAPGAMTGSYAIPSSVTSIGWAAFGGCSGLASITIPSSVTSIGNSAFWYCTGLTSITIPLSLTSIQDEAFGGCTHLTSITIPASVTSIGASPFIWCAGLTSILVDSSNPNYASSSGVLFDKAQQTLIEAPGATNSYAIPSSVTTIESAAFIGCGLTSIIIPSNVISIGSAAFESCSNLVSVTLQASTPPSLPASSNAFSNEPSGFEIHVPDASAVFAYKAATGWSDYASVIVTP